MNSQRIRWEVWECPTCGTQIGGGITGESGGYTLPPRCAAGHATVEMEQKFAEAMPRELRDRAERNPDIRADLGDVA